MLLREYYRDPEATAAAWSEDGWFRTGDRALLPEDGSIRFLGRYDDVRKFGGENVDPFEVEAFPGGQPAVVQAQVVAVPDPRRSEVPVVFVVARAGQAPEPEELMRFRRGRIAGFKVPRHFFVASLPRRRTAQAPIGGGSGRRPLTPGPSPGGRGERKEAVSGVNPITENQ